MANIFYDSTSSSPLSPGMVFKRLPEDQYFPQHPAQPGVWTPQQFTHYTDSQTESPLFRLPTELRLQIWSYLTPPVPRLPARSKLSSTKPTKPVEPQELHSQILTTCQLAYLELLPLLYSRPFTAHPTLLTSLPYHITRSRPVPPNLATALSGRWILPVRLDVDARWSGEEVCAAFDGAAELVLDVGQAVFAGVGTEVLCAFEGVRGVRVARVCGLDKGVLQYGRWLEEKMEASAVEEGSDESGEEDEGKKDAWRRGLEEGMRRGLAIGGKNLWEVER